jgi:LuxR family maltose regulon positive regulatory protein
MRADDPIGARGPSDGSLLATKFHVPPVKPGHVARQRLIDCLDATAPRDLVLVCAPAGSGKTALLAEWSRHHADETAWVSLDPGDGDPARFWRHLIAAIEPFRPGVMPLADTLADAGSAPLETIATGLINHVARDRSPLVLVLDDYHHVEDAAVHRSVDFLLDHEPEAMRLVIASRVEPPLSVPRRRAGGRLTEIRAADLRFTEREAAALLGQAGEPVSEQASTALTERTEGWATGLQLAAVSLRDQPSIEAFVAAFSGSHRYVLDYLTEEVLEQQDGPVRDFLLETSVLERLTADLCDAVTGRTDGQAMLERIERANLFLVPLDDVRGWWRFHHLFADLLRARLVADRPGRVIELHRAAAAWFDERDLGDAAIQHALAAGDTLWAARLVERHADGRLRAGEGSTLRGWLDRLPESLIAERPRLLLARADLALVSGDSQAFEQPFTAAERALASAPEILDEPYEPAGGDPGSLLANVPAALAIGRAHLAELSGDAAATGEYAARADALVDDDQWMLGILVRAHEAVSALLAGDVEDAAAGFAASFERCREAGERVLASRSLTLGGRAYRAAGRLDRALEFYREGLDWLAPAGSRPAPAAGPVWVGIAEVEYQRDRLDEAEAALDRGLGLCRELAEAISGSPQPLANGLALAAWIRQARGDPDGASSAMTLALATAPASSVTSLLNPVPVLAGRLRLAHGDLDAVVRWTEDRGLSTEAVGEFACEPEQLLFGRVLIARGRPDAAVRMLDRLALAAAGRAGSRIQIETLRALALAADGRLDEATTTVRRALDSGWDHGWRRVFIDEGPPMAALLDRVPSAPSALLAAFGAHPPAPSFGLVEPLTERECEVLRLVAAGRPNREIAGALFVTLDTVKKHVTHILGKLGAANRTEAVARARALGLLDDP